MLLIPITILFIVLLGPVSFIGEIGYARGVYFGGAEGGFYGRSRFEKACRQKISTLFFSKYRIFIFPRAALARAEIVFQNFLKNSSKIPPGDAAQ